MEALHLTSTQRMYIQKVVLVTKKLKKEGRNVVSPDILPNVTLNVNLHSKCMRYMAYPSMVITVHNLIQNQTWQ